MRYMLVILLLWGCSKKDDAKDREIAELRAQLAKNEAPPPPPSLGAIQPVASQGLPTKPQSEKPESFTLDIRGQLDRIDAEDLAREWQDGVTPADYSALLGLKYEDHRAEDVVAFEDRAIANKGITYAQLAKNAEKYAGKEWRFTGRILEIQEKQSPPITIARVSTAYYGEDAIYVFGRFTTDFVEGDSVDFLGYLAGGYSYTSQAGWNITVPAVAAYAMVKRGSIKRVRAMHAKAQTKSQREQKTAAIATTQEVQE